MATLLVSSVVDERAWWKDHPDPQITRTEDRLVLWNYPVGGTKLADGHAAALQSFVSVLALAIGSTKTINTIAISGHASPTGELSTNDALALQRAENAAKYLRTLGLNKLEVTSAGSSQPADPASTGQALARNRRVEITIYRERIEPPPRVRPEESTPIGKPPARPSNVGLYFEGEFEIPLGEVEDAYVSAKFTAVGKAKVKLTRGDPNYEEGLVLSGGKLTGEFKRKLAENLDGKVGLEPGAKGEPPSLKASLEGEAWGVPVEVGFKTDRHFMFMEMTWGTVKVPDIELDSRTFSLEIELTVQVEWGPSKAALARAGMATGLTLAEGAAVAGVIVVVAVIIGGTIYAIESGKQKMAELVVDAAMRDGAASRVTFEALGADSRVRDAYYQHRLDLTRVGGEQSRAGFETGQKIVQAYLDSLGDKRTATIAAWTEKYASAANDTDFDRIREKLLVLLGAYQNDPSPVESLISAL